MAIFTKRYSHFYSRYLSVVIYEILLLRFFLFRCSNQ